MTYRIVVCEESGVIVTEFIVTERDGNKLMNDYDTSWMGEDDLKEYLEEDIP
jgi:hypothetical protein